VSLNRIVKALILTVATSTAVLGTEGLYVGINMGQSIVQAGMERKSSSTIRNTSSSGDKSVTVGTFIGYNHLIQETPLFIGLELGVENHNLKIDQEENVSHLPINHKTVVKTNNSFTAIGKFGFIVKDLMIYAKAGVVKTNWSLSYSARYNNALGIENTVKTNKYGSIFGFGVDYKLNPNWLIGVDYSVKSYPDVVLKGAIANVTIKPTINTTSFRLMYSF
jgi:opacity protein-like surface antigen